MLKFDLGTMRLAFLGKYMGSVKSLWNKAGSPLL